MKHLEKKKKFVVVFVLIWSISLVSAAALEKVASFPDLMKPESIAIKHDRIFIVEGVTVSIYSLKDFKLIKKFGESGEGPQEFKTGPLNPLDIEILPDSILVNSIGKVSFFTLNGEFIREAKMDNIIHLQPLGKNFVGKAVVSENGKRINEFNIYDPGYKKLKTLNHFDAEFQMGQKIEVAKNDIYCKVFKDKIFIARESEFLIDVYDKDGKLLHTIRKKLEKRTVTEEDKKAIHEFFRLTFKDLYQVYIKDHLEMPEQFPDIRGLYADSEYLYVPTHLLKDGKTEFFMIDDGGKVVRSFFLPLKDAYPFKPYPYTFYEKKLYQLIENENTEENELFVVGIPGK